MAPLAFIVPPLAARVHTESESLLQVLKKFNHMLHRAKKIDFIEQFNEKLLIKQEHEDLQIIDVRSG